MNRPLLVLVGLLVVAGLVFFVVSTPLGGRFAGAQTCAELDRMFATEPVSDDSAERRQVGDEYRAQADQLAC